MTKTGSPHTVAILRCGTEKVGGERGVQRAKLEVPGG